MIGFLAFVLLFLFIYAWYSHARRKQVIPSGLKEMPVEIGSPLVGAFFQIERPHSFHVGKLGKKHGPLFAVRLGMREIVILNNYDIIRKALQEGGNVFSGRFTPELKKQTGLQSGIFFHDGETWARQRSFICNAFQDFGLGKSKCVEVVEKESALMLEDLRNHRGTSVNLSNFVFYYVANTICKFIMNKRYSRDSEVLTVVDQIRSETAKSNDVFKALGLMFPWLDSLPLYSKLISMFSTTGRLYERIFALIQLEIDQHSKRLDLGGEAQDLMDRFLIKQRKMKDKFDLVESFTDCQLVMVTYEMFSAGSETTTTSLEWSCMFMSRFPDVQDRIYLEILDKIGNERMVTMSDKASLDYTQAAMDEIMRMSSVVPFSIPHRTVEDTSIDNVFIPKDSIIYPNIHACHYDAETWDNPSEFRPERFLTQQADGQWKYSPRKELVSFGLGKRQCLGESLARTEFFIYFANIIQNFKIDTKDKIGDHLYEKALQGMDSLIRGCLIKEFVFKARL